MNFSIAAEHFKTLSRLPISFVLKNIDDLVVFLGIDVVIQGIKENSIEKMNALRFYACDVLAFFNKIKSLNDESAANLLTKESLAIWGLVIGNYGIIEMGPKIHSLLSL